MNEGLPGSEDSLSSAPTSSSAGFSDSSLGNAGTSPASSPSIGSKLTPPIKSSPPLDPTPKKQQPYESKHALRNFFIITTVILIIILLLLRFGGLSSVTNIFSGIGGPGNSTSSNGSAGDVANQSRLVDLKNQLDKLLNSGLFANNNGNLSTIGGTEVAGPLLVSGPTSLGGSLVVAGAVGGLLNQGGGASSPAGSTGGSSNSGVGSAIIVNTANQTSPGATNVNAFYFSPVTAVPGNNVNGLNFPVNNNYTTYLTSPTITIGSSGAIGGVSNYTQVSGSLINQGSTYLGGNLTVAGSTIFNQTSVFNQTAVFNAGVDLQFINLRGITSPGQASTGAGRIYFDQTTNRFKISQNGGSYVNLVGDGDAFVQNGNTFGTLAILGTNDNNSLAIRTNSVERARFDNKGWLGLGTATPAYTLDVKGSGHFTSFVNVEDLLFVNNSASFNQNVAIARQVDFGASPVQPVSAPNIGRIYYDAATNKFKVSENSSAYSDLVGGGGSSNGFVQNGNAFGTVASVGTTDNYNLTVKTAGTNRFSFDTTGNFQASVAPTTSLTTQTITTVGTIASTGVTSDIAIGSDNSAVIAFRDVNTLPRVIKCGNAACSAGNSTSPTLGAAGTVPRVAIGVDGLPILTYTTSVSGPGDLDVIKCGNVACSSGNITSVILTGIPSGAETSNIVIAPDGLPVVAYTMSDPSTKHLFLLKCGNQSCSSGNSTVVIDNTGAIGGTSVAIGTDGLPIISYNLINGSNYQLNVAKCSVPSCSSGNTITIVDSLALPSGSGQNPSITIGSDGLPIIAYSFFSPGPTNGLKITKCGTVACTTGNITTNVIASGTPSVPRIDVGPDGLAVVMYYYYPSTQYVEVLKCGNLACSAGNTQTTLDASASNPAFAIGGDGLPVIAYYDLSNPPNLKAAKCANRSCSSPSGSSLSNGSSVGSQAAPLRSLYFDTLNLGLKNARVVLNDSGTFLANSFSASGSGNIGIGTTNYGGASNNVLALASDSGTAPAATAGQGFLYVSAGALKYQGPSTLTNLANADYSESMPVEGELSPMEVAVVSTTPKTDADVYNNYLVTRATKSYDPALVGVVSSTPDQSVGTRQIALAGRVPVKFSLENGAIKVGDHLTSSGAVPGAAMTATKAGLTIGVALQPATISGTVLMLVGLSWFDPDAPVYSSAGTPVASSTVSPTSYELLSIGTANITNLNIGTVKIMVDSVGNLKLEGGLVSSSKLSAVSLEAVDLVISGSVTFGKDSKGLSTPVAVGSSTITITFTKPQPDSSYAVLVTPSWVVSYGVSNKTVGSFTINFSTPAPEAATLDWVVIR